MAALAETPTLMSTSEFLAWKPGGDQRWQLVNGEPQALARTGPAHGAVLNEIEAVIQGHLHRHGSQGTMLRSVAVVPHALSGTNVRIADLAVTCAPVQDGYTTVTAPVLVIKIISPDDWAETRKNTWAYASIPSVQEILVLRTTSVEAELLRREPGGHWPHDPRPVTEGDLVLDSIGLRTPLVALYRSMPPCEP